MQLVAYGAQDVYLTGNPQITFFKIVYRRHTNFSVEPIQQVWNGAADFGRTVTCNLNRNGDLIGNMYSVVELKRTTSSTMWAYVRRLGYALIAETKVEIGGSKIDEQYGDWLNIWYELSHKVGQERGHAKMIGDTPALTTLALTHGSSSVTNENILYIPLAYWFNRHNGLALPLIALQYHDVRVTIQFQNALNCINYAGSSVPDVLPSMDDSYLLIDYVYLDSEERKRFAQASHEYLIEQLQFTGSEALTATSNKYRLNFNHPSKYLVWATHLTKYSTPTQFVTLVEDNNVEAARERFAKHVWLATRTNLDYATPEPTLVDISGDVPLTVTDVLSLEMRSDLTSTVLGNVAGKITAQLILDGNFVDFSGAQGSTVTVDNVVLFSNGVTVQDMSLSVAELINVGSTYDNSASLYFDGNHSVTLHDVFNYGRWIDRSDNPVASSKLQLNGHDRFQERDGNYFNYVQPYQHFSNTPSDGINVYSFALKPEEHQPSGTCNFSRIDNATLNVTVVDRTDLSDNSNLNIYTVNYNVLRVMSGMAGTAYSN